MGWGGGHAATPGAMSQLPPQRTAKLGRAYRLIRHWLFDWWHFDSERWGGSHAAQGQEKGTGSICAKHPEGHSGKLYLSPFPNSATPGASGVLSLCPTTAQATARPDRGYNLVRLVVALLLLTAAALKGYDLASGPVVGSGLLESRWLLIGVVEMEILFGLWLLANIWPKLTWTVALVCFSLFTCVSLYKALSGYATCGCFGRVPVNPWYTTTLDLGIVLALLRWRPRGLSRAGNGYWFNLCEAPGGPSRQIVPVPLSGFRFPARAVGVVAAWLVVGLPAAYAMTTYTPTTLSDAGDVIGNGKVVVLEPDKWIGKRFPLLDYIDIGDRLQRGTWLVVLYQHDCPDCCEVSSFFAQSAALSGNPLGQDRNLRISLVQIPPYGDAQGTGFADHKGQRALGRLVEGRLSRDHDWFVQAPVAILVTNGKSEHVLPKPPLMRLIAQSRQEPSRAVFQIIEFGRNVPHR